MVKLRGEKQKTQENGEMMMVRLTASGTLRRYSESVDCESVSKFTENTKVSK